MHACIDLGSNSFHLLIGEWNKGRIKIVERCSDKVQLGEDVKSTGVISPGAFERGLACLARFKELMAEYPLENYWALGTNTFRVTDNAPEFIKAASAIGIDISVISGTQEAVLIYAGVITALPVSDVHRLVIDIGGGSTEIIIGSGHDRLLTESLDIGSVAWRDRFFPDAIADVKILKQQMEQGKTAACEVFDAVAPGMRKAGWTEIYASSGTVKMMSYVCEYHGYSSGVIQRKGLLELKDRLAEGIAAGEDILGVKESRRDLLLPGWCILMALMEVYGIESIRFSATALREGMLDFMVKNEKTMLAMERSGLPRVIETDS